LLQPRSLALLRKKHNAIKAAHRYAVQEGDATMLPSAAALFGQKKRNTFL